MMSLQFLVIARCGCSRAGRQAQVDRAAGLVAQPGRLVGVALAVALQVVEGKAHDHGELVDEGRLEGAQPVLRHADQRRRDGLVRPALRGQRDARGRRHQHEARILVAGVVQRIEPAL
jgi:hypothetical protein